MSREIPLTRGLVAIVDDDDYDRVAPFTWNAHRGGREVYTPGWKARATSLAAAEGIRPKARSLRVRVLEAIREQPGSPEMLAARLNEPVMNIRPRISELAAKGLVTDSGMRACAQGGKSAIVWRAL